MFDARGKDERATIVIVANTHYYYILMSHIFYKFKSAKDYDSYRFDGAGVPVWELKKEIISAKKLGKSTDFDLVLTNAQTNEGKHLLKGEKSSTLVLAMSLLLLGGCRRNNVKNSFDKLNLFVCSLIPNSPLICDGQAHSSYYLFASSC